MAELGCRGYGCTPTVLIEAHIVPRAFAKDVRAAHAHNLLISLEKVRQIQLMTRTFSVGHVMASRATSMTNRQGLQTLPFRAQDSA